MLGARKAVSASPSRRPYDSLRRQADFARVRRRGRRVQGTHVAIVAAAGGAARSRVAIVTAKAVGGAVERNRARRRLRAALDGVALDGKHLDMIVTARVSAATAPFSELCADLGTTLGRLGI